MYDVNLKDTKIFLHIHTHTQIYHNNSGIIFLNKDYYNIILHHHYSIINCNLKEILGNVLFINQSLYVMEDRKLGINMSLG